MLKKDLLKYMTGRCRHYHTYIEHPNCWWEEHNKEPAIGFLDIETTNLDANYGFIISYCILNDKTGEIIEKIIDIKDVRKGEFDKNFCKQLIQDMLKFDIVMGYWSTGFDIPYIRARCLKWKLKFPVYKTIEHKDIYYMVKRLMKLSRNSLETACCHLGIKGKNHVCGDKWITATMCDGQKQKQAMDYIIDHNRKDVLILRKLYHRLKEYDRGMTKSI